MENVSKLESLDTNTLKLILKNALEEKREKAQGDFLTFVKHVWPDFVEGKHHRIYAEKLNRIANGELKRLIVNMPPRHTKSEFASNLFPAFFMGRHPKAKLIQTTHTGELAIRFGRKAKNMIESTEYEKIFPKVALAADSKAAGRWESNHGGEYFAAGVGGAITGRVLIYSLLTTLTLSKMLLALLCLSLIMNGILLVLVSVFNQVVR